MNPEVSSDKQQPGRLDPSAAPLSSDELFSSLSRVVDVLDAIGVPYVLSGGTLLGAVREKNIIEGDTDWDLDCLDEHVPVILANRKLFQEKGIDFEYPVMGSGFSYAKVDGSYEESHNIDRCSIKFRDLGTGRQQGDLYVYTVFLDGIMRRFDFRTDTHYNAKMVYPAWFMENTEVLTLRGRSFVAPKFPVKIVEKVYGAMWSTPVRRNSIVPGYNVAGAVVDSDVETLVNIAMDNGWVPLYPQAAFWPRPVRYTNSDVSRRWIERHEHLEVFPESFLNDAALTGEQRLAKALAYYQMHLSYLKAQKKMSGGSVFSSVVGLIRQGLFRLGVLAPVTRLYRKITRLKK